MRDGIIQILNIDAEEILHVGGLLVSKNYWAVRVKEQKMIVKP